MSIYRIDFNYHETRYRLKAQDLDMTHPYFVSLSGLIMPAERAIIDPESEDIRRIFGSTDQLMIPLQSIHLIEVFESDPDSDDTQKVRSFPVVE